MSTFSICGPWTLAGVARCALSRKNSYSVAHPSLLGLATPDNALPHPRLVPPPLPHFQLNPKSPTLSPPTAPLSKLFQKLLHSLSFIFSLSLQVSRPAQSLAYRMRGKLESVNKKMHMIRYVGAEVAQMLTNSFHRFDAAVDF